MKRPKVMWQLTEDKKFDKLHYPLSTVKEQLIAVRAYPELIGAIRKPSVPVQIVAVREHPMVILKIKSPHKEAQKEAIRGDIGVLRQLQYAGITIGKEMQLFAVRHWPRLIVDILNPYVEAQILAVRLVPKLIAQMPKAGEDVQLAAIMTDWSVYKNIQKPTENVTMMHLLES